VTYPQAPQPPQQPGQPIGYPAPPPAKKSRRTLWIVLSVVGGVLALCCIGGVVFTLTAGKKAVDRAASDLASASPGQPAAPKKEDPKKATAKLGQPARDGKFEFVVTKVEHGKTQVGNEVLNKKPQGQFVLVSVTVKNIGSEAKTFDGSSQAAFGDGVKYSDDGTAEIYANTDNQTFLNQINPGNQAAGVLVFDIPAGKKITSVELHDSPFSGGVTVDVS
jgi:hypothetical protein